VTQTAIDFIKTVFGLSTELPVHFCTLGNERDGKHPFRKLDTRDLDELTAFIAKWDQKERGLFYCVSTLPLGAKARNKEDATELPMLFADIDLKDVDEDIYSIERKLKALKRPPSIIVRSGNGVHALWLFKEHLGVQDEGMIDRVEAALRQLADLVGGDLQVCEVARLMRLPGTHNTKNDEWKEVVVSHQTDVRYELGDLEEWLSETSPIILRKSRIRGRTVGEASGEVDYYAEYGALAYRPPIDVKARLDAMMYMAEGDASVHKTQTDVASSMVSKGHDDGEIVELLMAATKAAAGDYGKRWNWRAEERAIRKDLAAWRAKLAKRGQEPKPQKDAANSGANPTQSGDGAAQSAGNVVSLADAAAARAIKPKPKQEAGPDDANHIKIGTTVIGVIKARGDDLIFTEKASWFCRGGLWRMMTDSAWLNVEIEKAIVVLGYSSTLKLRSEARGWIQCQPALWRDDVPWDQHGKVPTLSGLVDPISLEIEPLKPEHYATWRIECAYDPAATCPWWLQMLQDVFDDRLPEVREQTIAVIQEILGAGLIDDKPREITRALIFQGGSNFGKSGLLEVLGGLFGQDQNSTPIEALEGTHGLMPFVRRAPWVLHEAFDQRKWHFSSSVKAIITGEPVGVNIKNGPMLSVRVRAPIFWGTNHPPQFKEATKAIVNRMVIIECRREFVVGEPVGAAKEAFARGLSKPSSLVLRDEMPGVLAWALEGLRRALERGSLSLTKEMIETGEAIRDDSNLVAGFLSECVVYDPDRRVSAPDFCLAFGAWWLANKGENRQVPSNESIGKNLLAMADSMIAISNKELRDNTRRYYAGIALNEEGLSFHRAGADLQELRGKTANATEPKGQVNSLIPDSWGSKPSIFAMRKRHEKSVTGASVTENAHRSPVTDFGDRSPSDAPSVTTQSPHQSPANNADAPRTIGGPKF
jgi:RepB DNA-primase from phage plasmid